MLIRHELKEPFVKNYSVMVYFAKVCFARNTFVHVTCLRFDFKQCSGDDIPVFAELPCNDYFRDDEEVDAIDKTE